MADNTKLLEDIAALKLKVDALKAAQAPPPDAQPLIDAADVAVLAISAELP